MKSAPAWVSGHSAPRAAAVPGIKDWVTVGGISLLENFEPKPNAAATFVILEPWSKRGSKLNVENIRARLQRELSGIREAVFIVALPPAIQGVGTVSGFEMEVQLKSGSLDFSQLEKGVRRVREPDNRAKTAGENRTGHKAARKTDSHGSGVENCQRIAKGRRCCRPDEKDRILSANKIRNILYKAHKKNKIKRVRKGTYAGL
jgi:hypothetical protein